MHSNPDPLFVIICRSDFKIVSSCFAILQSIAIKNEDTRRSLRKLGVIEVTRLIMDASFTMAEVVDEATLVIQAINS